MNTNTLRNRYNISDEFTVTSMNQSTHAVWTPNEVCWSKDRVPATVVAHCTHHHSGLNYYIIEIQNRTHTSYFTVSGVSETNVYDQHGYHGTPLRKVEGSERVISEDIEVAEGYDYAQEIALVNRVMNMEVSEDMIARLERAISYCDGNAPVEAIEMLASLRA